MAVARVRLVAHRAPPAGAAPPPAPSAVPRGDAGAASGRAARQTLDAAKRTAQQLNEIGRVTQKHGIKVIVHNHTEEFEPLADSSQRPYDVLLAETDPSLVAMELDIGWATVAGQNALELFKRAPGRFEIWHVKDVAGLAALNGLRQSAGAASRRTHRPARRGRDRLSSDLRAGVARRDEALLRRAGQRATERRFARRRRDQLPQPREDPRLTRGATGTFAAAVF